MSRMNNKKPEVYICYNGSVTPDDTADATILATLGEKEMKPHSIHDIESLYTNYPHTWIKFEYAAGHLINGQIYDATND